MKVIGILMIVALLCMSCAHVPQSWEGAEDMTPAQEEGRSLGELTPEERAEDFKKIDQFMEPIGEVFATVFLMTLIVVGVAGLAFLL